jgi:ribonuclease BN (tRNA processing enzyme)
MHRRTLIKGLGTLALGSSGIGTLLGQAQRGERGGARGARGAAAAPADTKTTLILLGTQGGPNVNLTRAQTASVVMAGGQPYLVDCGYGAVRGLVEAGIRIVDVRNVFVSHLHDDHTLDLAALLSLKWTNGNTAPQPVDVYGPYGSKQMVEGANAFMKGNVDIRMVDEGRSVKPETLFTGRDLTAPTVT